MAKIRKHATSVADALGAALVSLGVGAYSWPAGVIVAGAALLAGSWSRTRSEVAE